MQIFNKYNIIKNIEYFTIIVKCTDKCNYSCNYCCEYNELNNATNIDLLLLYIFIKHIFFNIKKLNKTLKISLYGGEPTLHPQLLEFCEKIKNFNASICIEIYTNLSANNELYLKLLLINTLLIITYHLLFMSYTDFFTKIVFILNIKTKNLILINLMYEHNEKILLLYNNLYKLINDLKYSDMLFPPILKTVRNTKLILYKYTKKEKNLFLYNIKKYKNVFLYRYFLEKTRFNKINFTDQTVELYNFSFTSWYCYAGITSIYIIPTGNIFTCLSNINITNSIGTIYNLNYVLNTKPIRCKSTICTDYDSKKINFLNVKTKLKSVFK